MYSYDRTRTAALDSVYNAVYGVISRMMAHIQPGLQKLEGADPNLGTFSQSGHLISVYVEGPLTVGGQPHYAAKWSIDIKASAMTNDVGIVVELNGNEHQKINFGGFTDSKHMADEIVRVAGQMRAKLSGRGA
jgi:hypothetical protein